MIWRDIPSFPFFQASEAGEICRVKMQSLDGRTFRQRHMKASPDTAGYPCVSVIAPTPPRYRKVRVSRLVCEAFNGKAPPDKTHALHNDGNTMNNTPSNLRWGDCQDNADDTVSHGRRPWGEAHPEAKLTERDVLAIRASNELGTTLAKRMGVSTTTISDIRLRKIWKNLEN